MINWQVNTECKIFRTVLNGEFAGLYRYMKRKRKSRARSLRDRMGLPVCIKDSFGLCLRWLLLVAGDAVGTRTAVRGDHAAYVKPDKLLETERFRCCAHHIQPFIGDSR